ncbi:MAG: (Fe-S)-binding protein [Verrucomicrobia bacterium]|nr:(Fe-S)-binding protein [Verrucomicrobiota bacterium]
MKTKEKTSRLKTLDYSVVQQCMHCGLCLPTCPTYDATLLERHSPRGRVALARAIADGRLEMTREFAEEMYYCLGCLACTSACPAGVNYAEIFERARAEAEDSGVLRAPRRNFIRWLAVKWLFMDLRRLRFAGRMIRLYQKLGIQSLVRRSGVLKLMPARLRELEAMTPDIQPKFSHELIPEVTPAKGEKRYRVALLTGCAQDIIFSDVNLDTAEVLAWNGCEVYTPREQSCCGSLHAHNGEWELAKILAKRQLEQFPPEEFDAIISNAGGCGAHMKHYAKFFDDDPELKSRAQLWDSKVKDVHEWLVEIGMKPVESRETPKQSVTYHESCHLCHGQKVASQPRLILNSIPNLELRELPESDWCCGSAGIYNIIQPEMANTLLDRKMRKIRETGAEVVANANSGCLLQLVNGAKSRDVPVRVVHPVTLLAEAYRRNGMSGKTDKTD